MNHNAIYVQLVEHAKKRNLTRYDIDTQTIESQKQAEV